MHKHKILRFLINDQRNAQFFSMYLFMFLTLYMFRAHRAHHQERQIVSIQPLVAVGGRVVAHHQERQIVSIQPLVPVGGRVLCRSEVNFQRAHDTATDTE